jgi:uncharacterized protein
MASIVTNRALWISLLFSIMLPLSGCSKPAVINGIMPVEIGGRTFQLEIVADDETRNLGLGGRTQIDADKGMLFSFPDSKLRRFVMRDCLIDIDIIYLDSAGRIIAMHHMPIEDPKGENETLGVYELRLKKYSSRYNAQYAIELAGGMLEELDLNEGEFIKLDTEYLQSITK